MIKQLIFKLFLISTCFYQSLHSVEKLDEKYRVFFGNPNSSMQFIQYFSLNCPHCIQLFNDDFNQIYQEYLKTGQAGYTFHPVPLNESTVQMMECLSHLSGSEKRSLLDALISNLTAQDDKQMALHLMNEAMHLFNYSEIKLDDLAYLKSTQTAKDCVQFLAQEDKITAVPSIEVNQVLYRHQAPTYNFIKNAMIEGKTKSNE